MLKTPQLIFFGAMIGQIVLAALSPPHTWLSLGSAIQLRRGRQAHRRNRRTESKIQEWHKTTNRVSKQLHQRVPGMQRYPKAKTPTPDIKSYRAMVTIQPGSALKNHVILMKIYRDKDIALNKSKQTGQNKLENSFACQVKQAKEAAVANFLSVLNESASSQDGHRN